ncbi:cytochrome P450 [Gigaspora margarita]|uniref:Cytochrome P450 n=1 Tax=Gigaspora margarita TaxID=4874 RepID=A0A8H4ACP0_GIGMA|nr:cytochrome P450 [Gigaspora margarita]
MEYYLCDSDYEPINVNDEYMEYLFEQLIVTLFAAFFTTVKVVTEALYEYAGRPELWKDIFEEQIMIYNKTNANLTIDDIHKMAKLDSLLKEILRHSFPVVLKTTMNNESYTFNTGAKIPKGIFIYRNVIINVLFLFKKLSKQLRRSCSCCLCCRFTL